MSTSHQQRQQHLSLVMYHARQGPPEVLAFIDGCLSGDLELVSKHMKKRRRKQQLGSDKIAIDINQPVLENHLPLFLACQGQTKAHAGIVRHLIKKGAKTRDSKTGRLGLHRACACDSVEVVREWLGLMPNQIAAQSFDGSTPLSIAAQSGSKECLGVLIKNGADPDVRTVNKSTALYLACCTNNLDIVNILLVRGRACPLIDNQDGETPLFRAATDGNMPIVQRLLDIPLPSACIEATVHSAAGQTALVTAARYGHVEIVQALLEAGADMDHGDSQGRTALYAASQEGHANVVQLLLNNKCDLEPHVENGSSPLMVSAQGGHLKTFELLISSGADLNVVDASNRSLFEICCIGGDYGVLCSLIKHGGVEKRWKIPVYLMRNFKKSSDVGRLQRIQMALRHKTAQKEIHEHLRMCAASIEEANLQCAAASEMANRCELYAEMAKTGAGVGLPTEEQEK